LRVPAGYNLLLDSARQARLEEVVQQVCGAGWTIRFETGAPAAPRKAAENGHVVARRLRTEVAELPLVKKAMDLLGAQIVHVDENFGAVPPSGPDEATGADEES